MTEPIKCSCGLWFDSKEDFKDHQERWKKLGSPRWKHTSITQRRRSRQSVEIPLIPKDSFMV
jgi:hypothetical protein